MSVKNGLAAGFSSIISKAGLPIRIRYFTQSYDDVYDDSVVLTQSGTDLWTSGIFMPISTSRGTDFLLLEQGKIDNSDSKLYANGSLVIIRDDLQAKITIGSPGIDYSVLSDGAITHQVEGVNIYKKVYLRKLTGSLIGE